MQAPERLMPSALESERQVLGTALLGADYAVTVVDELTADDFYSSAHRQVFEIIHDLVAQQHPVDIIVVMQALKAKRASGEELLMLRDMAEEVLTPTGVRAHIRTVREKAMLRELMRLGSEMSLAASEDGADPAGIAAMAESLVFRATERQTRGAEVGWAKAVGDVLDRMEYMHNVTDPITGVPTGYAEIDHRLFGLQPEHLYLVAARPSVGKTSFVTGAALHAAGAGMPVAFFSLEMSAQEIAQRMVCSHAEVSFSRVRVGRVRDEEWSRLIDATAYVAGLPVHVFDAGVATVMDMTARARRIRGLQLIVVDYIQLAKHHKRTASKNEEVSEISRALKLMARQLQVPVLACAQLNREIENRKGRPKLSDLRDSGALEQDADVVMFLHNPSDDEIPLTGGPIEIVMAKNRNGAQGIDRLRWIPQLTRFQDLTAMEAVRMREDSRR